MQFHKVLSRVALILTLAAPLHAQTIPQDFRGWWNQQIVGKPANQFVLESLNLPCVGAAITPPNAAGAKSKIWDPQTKLWTRVIEGDPIRGGSWTWVITDQGPAPVLTAADLANCTAPPGASAPAQTLPPFQSMDLTPLLARLDSIIAGQRCGAKPEEQSPLCQQAERIFANKTQQIQNLSDQLQAHDEKTSTLVALLSNRYTQLILATVGTYLTTHQVMK